MYNYPIPHNPFHFQQQVAQVPHSMRALKLHGALPPLMQRTAWEIHSRTGVSLEAVIPLMLGIAAFACQGVANVGFPPDRQSPLSLFLTVVAEPANGKSETLNLLLQPVYRFETERQTELASADNTDVENKYQILFSNMSKEAIPQRSGLMMEEEGEEFLESRVGRAYPTHSKMWDGRMSRVNRVTRESTVGDHVRMGLILTLPPGHWQRYIQRRGERLLDSGLGSRMLVAEVFGTQESQYTEERLRMGPPKVLPEWEERLLMLLRQSVWTSQEVSVLPVLHMTEDAKRCWMEVGRRCEWGAQHQVPTPMRPHALRFPQMVGRVAAVLHLIEGRVGLLSAEMIERAVVICDYFFDEALRMLLPPPKIPQAHRDAEAVENLLRCQPGGSMSKPDLIACAQMFDISKARAEKAVLTLVHGGRVCLKPEGRRVRVCITGYPVFSV